MDDNRSAVCERGDPKFSQRKKVVEFAPSPEEVVESKERARTLARIEKLQERLNGLELMDGAKTVESFRGKKRLTVVEAIKEVELLLDEAVERLRESTVDIDTANEVEGELTYLGLSDVMADIADRKHVLRVLLAYVYQDGIANPWEAFKNLCAVTRRVCPEYLDISQTEMGALLNETRAAPCAREKRVVEGIARRFGIRGFHFLGETKTEESRRKFSEAQKIAQEDRANRLAGRRGRGRSRSTKPVIIEI